MHANQSNMKGTMLNVYSFSLRLKVINRCWALSTSSTARCLLRMVLTFQKLKTASPTITIPTTIIGNLKRRRFL